MKLVYLIDNSKKKDLDKALAADPYEDISFAKIGYTLRDGALFEKNGKQILLLTVNEPADEKYVKEKLKDLGEEATGEAKDKIIKKIEDEESAAEAGFGNLFG